MSIILLASYPKSGNTWMRALLSNYLSESDEPVSINKLVGISLFSRHYFDENLGLSSAIMTYDEILQHRPKCHELLAMDVESVSFAKTHEPYICSQEGNPLFSPESISGVIYIIRNPLDIVISYAHHNQCEINRSIGIMNDGKAMLSDRHSGIFPALPQLVSDWSRNVSSWLDQDTLPMKIVSYESMHKNPDRVLSETIDFCGLDQDQAKLVQAVENSSFDNLQVQEAVVEFKMKQPTAPNFFRKGEVGDWKATLSDEQVRCIIERHGTVMERLGYLDGQDVHYAKP
ncbi:MAG: sulfotransferase domain-containing protein [Gammaproteobacteria bacterium]|nr:sulfotransferase domain-containing protein [Gammaproteobacteria bacterium]